ncbi:multidrug ABC transporter ATP-binding protein [Boudabousia liubingyangii]|uniref:Fatty acid ABC transporter ATP-binding/permease protein n=1 Tax=Boudabousia liubingyangii TaxID=1921764 RepID=A0A1Q5PQ74_9ACTO|nr:ABC transporter ATP-binding protein [Boudabousia liubingyangii]OKL48304.1 multidrug ABC transporter ATP-binding protein [Boudabousia liubingyangii]OKL49659.1 multidrug ABC transporter ATP-binding protein [Boudabousia liubingyangii]
MSHHGRGADPTRKTKDFKGTMLRLILWLKPERLRLNLILLFTALAVAGSVAAPKILGNATNIVFEGIFNSKMPAGVTKAQLIAGLKAQGKGDIASMVEAMNLNPGAGTDWNALAKTLGLVVAIYVASSVISFIAGLMMRIVVQNTGYRMRRQVQDKIDRVTLAYLDGSSRGDLLSRVTNDIDNITQTLMQTMTQLLTSILTLFGMLGMMFWISWQLALLTLIIIPFAMIIGGFVVKKAKPHFSAQWKATGQVSGVVEEAFTGQEVTTLYGLQEQFAQNFEAANSQVQQSTFKAQFFSSAMMPLMVLLSNLAYVMIAVAGGYKVASGTMTLGDVQAFIQYSRQFTQPLSTLASMASMLQSGAASAERVFEFLDAEELSDDVRTEQDRAAGAPHEDPAQDGKDLAVSFRDVDFSYVPGKPIITDLTLEVPRGHTVAIVGPTGAGKTTLVNLLMRFYEIDSGAIYVDGINTLDLKRDDLRSRIGMVLQDTWLFTGSIMENLAFGKVGATEEEVIAAAKATNVDRIIRSLPDGYQTHLDESGGGISNGERQLLTIARAFLADPQILILDEATSSVDTRTEVLVQHAMNKLRSGRTSFVIAHRLSTIRDADLIVVMENGNVVEQGTHRELLAANGAYRRLHDAQLNAGTEADTGEALMD